MASSRKFSIVGYVGYEDKPVEASPRTITFDYPESSIQPLTYKEVLHAIRKSLDEYRSLMTLLDDTKRRQEIGILTIQMIDRRILLNVPEALQRWIIVCTNVETAKILQRRGIMLRHTNIQLESLAKAERDDYHKSRSHQASIAF